METTESTRFQEIQTNARVAEWFWGEVQMLCNGYERGTIGSNPESFDAIVVLSHGRPSESGLAEETVECRARVYFALNFFDRGKAGPVLVLNAAKEQAKFMLDWAHEAVQTHCLSNVRIEALARTPFPDCNTMTQFRDLNDEALKRGWRHIAILTSDYHDPRASLYGRKYLSSELKVVYLPMAWALGDERMSFEEAQQLLEAECHRCVIYTRKGDLAYPWDHR